MTKIRFILLLIIALNLIFSCSNPKPQKSNNKIVIKNNSRIDSSVLLDKNFVYKNLTNTLNVKLIEKRLDTGFDNNLYTDSTYKRTFPELTPNQKIELIAPFISKLLNVNEKYPRDLMKAYFISKQNKIGDLQPIIVQIGGDDYNSLTMIILDSYGKPLSGFNVSGGMDGGPTEIGDSLISYEARSYSHINNNEITTYRITEIDHTDTTKKQITIDSNVFKSFIKLDGTISTKQIVKTTFTKLK